LFKYWLHHTGLVKIQQFLPATQELQDNGREIA
jgi:hypothetical protein